MIVNCGNCGKELKRKPFLVKIHKNHYCNKICANKGRIKDIKLICDGCGEEYITKPYLIKVKGKHYCSRKCSCSVFKKDLDKENIVKLYNSGISSEEIGRRIKISPITIRNRLQEWGIELRIDIPNGENHPLYKKESMKNNYGYVMKSIYEYPKEYHDMLKSMARPHHAHVLEHRAEMAIHLGRKLSSDEIVHHINGIRTDNRISNLQLVTRANHRGEITCPYCRKKFGLR